MKKIFVFLVFVMMLSAVSTGYAQVRAGSFTVSPNVGVYLFEGNEDMNNNMSFGLRAGYNFTKYFGVEGFYNYVPTGVKNTNERLDYSGYGVEGLLHIFPNAKLVPFLAVGVGGIHYSAAYQDTTENKKDKFAVDYGYGLKYFVSDNVALRFDIRHVLPFSDLHNNLLMSVGLSFAFGGAKKTAAVVEGAAAPQPAAPAVVEEVKPQPAAPAVVEEVKPQPAAPAVVEEKKPQTKVAKEIEEKGRTTLNVLFATNKDIIKKNYFKDIDDLVAVMKQYKDLNVTIEGHTDNVGAAAYNKKLSQRRAEAVKKYMVKKGIDAKRLTAKGYGLEKPVASNKTKEGRQKNRRVEAAADYVIKK